MSKKKLSLSELEKLSGVSRQSISYIISNNVKRSKLSQQLANALNVSHDWLAYGVNDNSFLVFSEVLVFTDLYLLSSFILNNIAPNDLEKSVTSHHLLQRDGFVFNPKNTTLFYYCSKNLKISSLEYLSLNLQDNSFKIVETKKNDNFSYPIIEFKKVIVEN